ncbi:MAG TPA: NAD(P)-dependent oxidoreductase [Bryobacteraceae bacterium]|nr:NAD(P)-dependent oxidoreductase [Bryobacteraceae bacterium]
MKIAFIGLGRMGAGMARGLLRAGHELTVYNRSREKADALAGDGARVAHSPAKAVMGTEVVCTMVADDAAVRDVVFGQDGFSGAMAPGAVHVSHSTISTAIARELASAGAAYVSAPVFGRPDAAEAKRLIVVAAGAAEHLERCRPIFDAIGRQTVVAGREPWQANAVKVCGNFMIGSMLEAFGEAFAVMRKAGVNPHTFLETINGLMASPVYAGYGAMLADERFLPAGFTVKLALKDANLALATAEECTAPMPLCSLVRDRLLAALANGQGEMDWSSFGLVAARNAGL